MKERLYLVTGAAGNLGSSVCSQLLSEGEAVRGLVLAGDPAAKRLPAGVEVLVGDVTDKVSLERFFTTAKKREVYVIHCASLITVAKGYSAKVQAVNVAGTQNIIEACLKHRVKKLVYVSSTSAIPELPQGQMITEVDHYDPETVIGFYGKTKAWASQLVMDAAFREGLDASIIFPSGICGPEDYSYALVAGFLIDYVNGKMPAGVAGSFNAVDVRDLADGVISCARRGRQGEGYIMANECVTLKEMFQLTSRLCGVKETKLILPAPFGYLLGYLCDGVERLTHKPLRMTSFAVYNLVRNNQFSSEKAVRELGFHTRPFEQTIADTLEWLAREGKIAMTPKAQGMAQRPSRT